MESTPLVDFSPLLHVMLLGIAVATGPLAWIALRKLPGGAERRLRALTVLTLFLTFDLVLFGAFTRLTDSGLGCPDWPGCYGHASPIGASEHIAAAQAQMPTGPVTHTKAWIEMIHRYLATGVGVLIVTLLVARILERRRGMRGGLAWPVFTLAWVMLQGAFGALTVTMKLQPLIVTGHLLGGMVLVALLARQAVVGQPIARVTNGLRHALLAAFALLWLQIALGAWVSTNYAVLACSEFPRCQASWWPDMDFRQGFELWRELGRTGAGDHIGFPALTAIHYTHRLAAYVVFAVTGALAWRLLRTPGLERQGRALGALALLQLATGLSNVVLGWPLVAAVAHTGGAAALVAVFTWALCIAQAQPDAVRSATRREASA